MRLLVLGGNAFLGRTVAEQALGRGYDVTCATRSPGVPGSARHVRVDRDRDDGLGPLAGEGWEAVVDVARQPGHVRRAVRDLSTRHYVFVSTVNVYADSATPDQDESAELLAPLDTEAMTDPSQYGAAKVACEQHVSGLGSVTIARAGLLGGPGDAGGRSGYWPWRFRRSDRVLVPDVADQPVQLLDARDLAAWLLDCARDATSGTFNATGATTTFGQAVTAAAEGSVAEQVPMSATWLAEHRVSEWMGPRSLPLWLADPAWHGMLTHDSTAARRAGLQGRALAETLRDAPYDPATAGAGLTDAEHDELLAAV